MINQGDIYWVDLGDLAGSEPGYLHPHVVIQNNIFNASNISTVIVCSLTSNLKRAIVPGNVLLELGEANLSKQSVVVVSQIQIVNKAQLVDYIGSISRQRIRQILDGVRLLTEPREPPR